MKLNMEKFSSEMNSWPTACRTDRASLEACRGPGRWPEDPSRGGRGEARQGEEDEETVSTLQLLVTPGKTWLAGVDLAGLTRGSGFRAGLGEYDRKEESTHTAPTVPLYCMEPLPRVPPTTGKPFRPWFAPAASAVFRSREPIPKQKSVKAPPQPHSALVRYGGEGRSNDAQRQRPAGRGRAREVTNWPRIRPWGTGPGRMTARCRGPGSMLDHERTAARQT